MGLRYVGFFVLIASVIFGIYVKSTTGSGYFAKFSPIESTMYLSISIVTALMGAIFIGCGYIVEAIDKNSSEIMHLLSSKEKDKYLDEIRESNKKEIKSKSNSDGTDHDKIREILKR